MQTRRKLEEERDLIASLVDSSWHYLFTLYFHLEQQAKSAGTTPTGHQE